jgi:hypothetical protein
LLSARGHMTVSIRRYTELKLAISDYVQSQNWDRLFELCGTSDDETAKTIAVIFTFFDEKGVWKFLSYVKDLDPELRRERRDSVVTASFVIGKMGQSNIEKSLDYLKRFLSSDHALRGAVTQALSNLWVLEPKKTARILISSWILGSPDSEDLQEIAVRSSQFLAERSPGTVSDFLRKVSSLQNRKAAARIAGDLVETYIPQKRARKVAPKIRRKR